MKLSNDLDSRLLSLVHVTTSVCVVLYNVFYNLYESHEVCQINHFEC